MKQLKSYSVVCWFITTCMLSPYFKVASVFLWFLVIPCANPLVWYGYQGKQSTSSE